MKNGIKYKIDANDYASTTFPVALFQWESGKWFGGWKHVESFRSVADAREAYDKIPDEHLSLPINL